MPPLAYAFTIFETVALLVFNRSVFELQDRIVEGGETLLVIRRFHTGSGFDDCGDGKRFVNIDTTTGLVSNFHSQTPFVKDEKPLTELPHN